MALNEPPADQNPALSLELECCASCREEYASIRNALRVADQAAQFTLPAESFWLRYNTRLRLRLESDSNFIPSPFLKAATSIRTWLGMLMRTSVPVPLPVATAFFVFAVFLALFVVHRSQLSATIVPAPPVIITKTVQVPVIQERPVTRVVYRRAGNRYGDLKSAAATPNTIARQQDNNQLPPPSHLAGFTPANEVKLTIIKGSYRDEK